MRRFVKAFAVPAYVISIVLMGSVGAASAHSEPVVVTPAACTTVDSLTEITIDLSAEADVDNTTVTASVDGAVVSSGGVDLADIDHQRVVLSMPSGLSGRVDVAWATRSAADGEDASGSYAFAIGSGIDAADCGNAQSGSSSASWPSIALAAGSVLVVIALVQNVRHRAPSDQQVGQS